METESLAAKYGEQTNAGCRTRGGAKVDEAHVRSCVTCRKRFRFKPIGHSSLRFGEKHKARMPDEILLNLGNRSSAEIVQARGIPTAEGDLIRQTS